MVNWINIAQEKLPWKDILPNVESMLLDDGMTEISKKSTLFVSKHENVDNRRNIGSNNNGGRDNYTSLSLISVTDENSHFRSIDDVLFKKSEYFTLIKCPPRKSDAT